MGDPALPPIWRMMIDGFPAIEAVEW